MTNPTTTTEAETVRLHTIPSIGPDQTLAFVLKGYDVFQRKLLTPLSDVYVMLFPVWERW